MKVCWKVASFTRIKTLGSLACARLIYSEGVPSFFAEKVNCQLKCGSRSSHSVCQWAGVVSAEFSPGCPAFSSV